MDADEELLNCELAAKVHSSGVSDNGEAGESQEQGFTQCNLHPNLERSGGQIDEALFLASIPDMAKPTSVSEIQRETGKGPEQAPTNVDFRSEHSNGPYDSASNPGIATPSPASEIPHGIGEVPEQEIVRRVPRPSLGICSEHANDTLDNASSPGIVTPTSVSEIQCATPTSLSEIGCAESFESPASFQRANIDDHTSEFVDNGRSSEDVLLRKGTRPNSEQAPSSVDQATHPSSKDHVRGTVNTCTIDFIDDGDSSNVGLSKKTQHNKKHTPDFPQEARIGDRANNFIDGERSGDNVAFQGQLNSNNAQADGSLDRKKQLGAPDHVKANRSASSNSTSRQESLHKRKDFVDQQRHPAPTNNSKSLQGRFASPKARSQDLEIKETHVTAVQQKRLNQGERSRSAQGNRINSFEQRKTHETLGSMNGKSSVRAQQGAASPRSASEVPAANIAFPLPPSAQIGSRIVRQSIFDRLYKTTTAGRVVDPRNKTEQGEENYRRWIPSKSLGRLNPKLDIDGGGFCAETPPLSPRHVDLDSYTKADRKAWLRDQQQWVVTRAERLRQKIEDKKAEEAQYISEHSVHANLDKGNIDHDAVCRRLYKRAQQAEARLEKQRQQEAAEETRMLKDTSVHRHLENSGHDVNSTVNRLYSRDVARRENRMQKLLDEKRRKEAQYISEHSVHANLDKGNIDHDAVCRRLYKRAQQAEARLEKQRQQEAAEETRMLKDTSVHRHLENSGHDVNSTVNRLYSRDVARRENRMQKLLDEKRRKEEAEEMQLQQRSVHASQRAQPARSPRPHLGKVRQKQAAKEEESLEGEIEQLEAKLNKLRAKAWHADRTLQEEVKEAEHGDKNDRNCLSSDERKGLKQHSTPIKQSALEDRPKRRQSVSGTTKQGYEEDASFHKSNPRQLCM
eukprot:TRINITY_DN1568_c0_g1_i1.p1 TRINITY_DN1568_c0_g1~~TRINITY_DN1568_c0_g1_i1.p1  ORF type:complete len:908 (-),score=148.96 TRINITY_DN1568_c0_g1_i1:197-2920(-)